MVYNLRSIGMSLIGNAGQSGCSAKPDDEVKRSLKGSSNTASTSSLNNPTGNQSFFLPANQTAAFLSYPCQNTNQNHASDTYVSLMSSFEEGRTSKYKRRKQTEQNRTMEQQNDSVINLDSSLDQTILDISNNSSPSDADDSTNSGYADSNRKFVCSILNCASKFSSKSNLENHMELFKHSPCNPCLLTTDGKVASDPLCYMCPECDLEFATHDECSDHINRRKHLSFFPPVAITAYMCSQCLHLFESFHECWTHIEKQSHHGMSYPFANDHACTSNKLGGPVAVAKELVQDMISKCNKVAYRVQCLECGVSVDTPAILKHHMRETQNQHVVAALTETSVVEVFANYLAGYSCNTCHRLFTGELKEMAKHQCAQRVVGTIVENDTCSFSEFVKRCALTVIKSLEVGDTAGPSGILRSRSPVCDRRNVQNEIEIRGAAASAETSSFTVNDENRFNVGNNNDVEHISRVKVPRKTRWDVKTRDDRSKIAVQRNSNMSKVTGATCLDTQAQDNSAGTVAESNASSSLHSDNIEKTKIKNVKQNEINNNDESFILIEDTDDASDETDADLPTNNGAKRKRKTKSGNKKCSSPERKLDNGCTRSLRSPFIVMNYKPRPSRLQGNVLTQGYSAQQCEKRPSPIKALSGGKQQTQSQAKAISPSKYMLKPRSNEDTSTSTDQTLDDGFGNIAQKFLQEEVAMRGNPMLNQEGYINGLTANKRDRSCSPVKRIDFLKSSNVLTQGHSDPPYLKPVKAMEEMNDIMKVPTYPPPIHGPTHYHFPNRCTFTGTFPRPIHTLPPPLLPYRHSNATVYTTPFIRQPFQSYNYQRGCPSVSSQQPSSSNSSSHYAAQGPSTASASANAPIQPRVPLRRPLDHLISTEHLSKMKNVVFLDLDNWPSFFHKLPCCLPDFTFVWGFYGGKNPWYAPMRLEIFREMRQKEQFYLNERCGTTKDAADFAIVLAVGKMDEKLPTDIAFTIMSGDKGFCEVERQMQNAERKVMVVNPHLAARFSNDMIYALVTSVTDT